MRRAVERKPEQTRSDSDSLKWLTLSLRKSCSSVTFQECMKRVFQATTSSYLYNSEFLKLLSRHVTISNLSGMREHFFCFLPRLPSSRFLT
jgi:hypothetical protein